MQTLYVGQIMYVLCVGCTKISTALFVSVVLARESRSVLIARASTVSCASWTVASVLVVSLRGNLEEPWATMNGSETMVSQ